MKTFAYSVTQNRRGVWKGFFTLSWICGDRCGGCCSLPSRVAAHDLASAVERRLNA